MGRKFTGINIFKKKLLLKDYENLSPSDKLLIDYTIKESLKINKKLRIKGLFKRSLKCKIDNIWMITWSDRIEIGNAIEKQDIYFIFKYFYGITKKQFIQLELYNAFSVYKYILEEFKKIVDAEYQNLNSEMSEEDKEAGAEELQQFGYSVALDGIAKGDLLKYNDYLQLPYSKVFRKMYMDKTIYEINKQYQENASRKVRTDY